MSNDRVRIERMIRSVSDLPKPSPGFRRRVLRSARKAEKDRTRARLWRSLCLSAAAVTLLVCAWYYPDDRNADAMNAAQPRVSPMSNGNPDWHLVDEFERERAVQSGVIRGSF